MPATDWNAVLAELHARHGPDRGSRQVARDAVMLALGEESLRAATQHVLQPPSPDRPDTAALRSMLVMLRPAVARELCRERLADGWHPEAASLLLALVDADALDDIEHLAQRDEAETQRLALMMLHALVLDDLHERDLARVSALLRNLACRFAEPEFASHAEQMRDALCAGLFVELHDAVVSSVERDAGGVTLRFAQLHMMPSADDLDDGVWRSASLELVGVDSTPPVGELTGGSWGSNPSQDFAAWLVPLRDTSVELEYADGRRWASRVHGGQLWL